MRRTENYHHTTEQVGDYLDRALAILAERELSEAERARVLPALVTLLSSKQLFYEQPAPVMLDPRPLGNARRQ